MYSPLLRPGIIAQLKIETIGIVGFFLIKSKKVI